VWLGEISYEIFLIHVIMMAIATDSVLRRPVFTGSMTELFVVTLMMTIPLAWVLHRATHPDRRPDASGHTTMPAQVHPASGPGSRLTAPAGHAPSTFDE
jgi:peptidoglycan/LPS O-acetylase OafA/YrhL